jgi:hypothetical protein
VSVIMNLVYIWIYFWRMKVIIGEMINMLVNV